MLHSAFIGAIVGLIWWLALGTITAVYVAAVCGGCLGILIGFMGVAVSSRGNVNHNESALVSGYIIMSLGILAGIIGFIVWLVRVFTD